MRLVTGGVLEQCQHRWTSKECPHCKADNDIAARYCCECNGEIIDPNEKLAIEFARRSIPTEVRPSFKEVEQICRKTKRKEAAA